MSAIIRHTHSNNTDKQQKVRRINSVLEVKLNEKWFRYSPNSLSLQNNPKSSKNFAQNRIQQRLKLRVSVLVDREKIPSLKNTHKYWNKQKREIEEDTSRICAHKWVLMIENTNEDETNAMQNVFGVLKIKTHLPTHRHTHIHMDNRTNKRKCYQSLEIFNMFQYFLVSAWCQ